MITITEAAANKIKTIAEGKYLRIGIEGGGCSGFSYVMEYTDEQREGDIVGESNGIEFVVDAKSALYLEGLVIETGQGLLDSPFTFHNPNAKRVCGCGTSFSA